MTNSNEYLNSIDRINSSEIKNIVSIKETNLQGFDYFMGTKIPKEWKGYSTLLVTYIPLKFNGGFPESLLVFFTNENEKNTLISLLNKS